LGMAGRNPLDLDAQLLPPRTEARQAPGPRRGKRPPIVAANALGQPPSGKQLRKGPLRRLHALREQGLHRQHVATGHIADGQRLAPPPIPGAKSSLEIHRPHCVGSARLAQRHAHQHRSAPSSLGGLAQPLATHNPPDRAAGRYRRGWSCPPLQQHAQLLGSPVRVLGAQLHDALHPDRTGLTRAVMRAARSVAQPGQPVGAEAVPPLVARLATDAELTTQRRHRFDLLFRFQHKLNSLFHWIHFQPSHELPPGWLLKCYPCVDTNLLPMSPGRTHPNPLPQGERRGTLPSPRLRCDKIARVNFARGRRRPNYQPSIMLRFDSLLGVVRGPYTFLRNEPTVFLDDFCCSHFIYRNLHRLQSRFAGGFVLENEPNFRGYLMSLDAPKRRTNPFGDRSVVGQCYFFFS